MRGGVAQIGQSMDVVEGSAAAMETILTRMELARMASEVQAVKLRLLIEDHEDRCQRNNIRIKGTPERLEGEGLSGVLQELFAHILDLPPRKINR